MADQQAGSNPPELDDPHADARAAYAEVAARSAETVDEKPEVKAELEVKAEPVKTEQPEPKADHPTDEKRYADGTFKPTKEEVAAAKAEPVKTEPAKVEPGPQVGQQQAAPVAGSPPGGFSPRTKAEWEKLPEYVRADILKREKEVSDGFAQYEGMRELRPYVDLARSQGQTLKQALDRYTGIENSLRQKPLDTILYLAGNAGYPPQRLAMELAPYLGQSNGQQNGALQNGAQPPFDPSMLQQWLNPVLQEVSQLKSQFQQRSEADRGRVMATINTAVDRFKADPAHRYYENVEPKMTQLIEAGVVPNTGDHAADLQAAYDMACWQDPEIRQLLISEQAGKAEAARVKAEKEAAEKARQASRSITGSPSSTVRESDDGKAGGSPHDDARRAYREVSARV